MSNTIRSIFFLIVAIAIVPPSAVAEPVDEFKVCARCHEEDGNSDDPELPLIAGLSSAYIDASLREYRAGNRECATSKMKCRMAAKWSDEEISRSAAHFAQFQRVAPEQPFDAELAAAGQVIDQEKCSRCHSGDAVNSPGTQPAGLLNGQWREYLEYALDQYASGGRQQPEEMRAALETLDATQIDALLNFYASGQ